MLRTFTPVKIQRLRSGLNPQTWVPEASMLTTRPPKPSAARSKAWAKDRWIPGIAGSNRAECMRVCFLWVLCCQVEVSETGWSLVQRSFTECAVSECDFETSTMRRPRSTKASESWKTKIKSADDFITTQRFYPVTFEASGHNFGPVQPLWRS